MRICPMCAKGAHQHHQRRFRFSRPDGGQGPEMVCRCSRCKQGISASRLAEIMAENREAREAQSRQQHSMTGIPHMTREEIYERLQKIAASRGIKT